MITIGTLIVVGISTFATSYFVNKSKQTTKTKASGVSVCTQYPAIAETPANYRWVADCGKGCSNNDQCKTATSPGWCYGFTDGSKCMTLEWIGQAASLRCPDGGRPRPEGFCEYGIKDNVVENPYWIVNPDYIQDAAKLEDCVQVNYSGTFPYGACHYANPNVCRRGDFRGGCAGICNWKNCGGKSVKQYKGEIYDALNPPGKSGRPDGVMEGGAPPGGSTGSSPPSGDGSTSTGGGNGTSRQVSPATETPKCNKTTRTCPDGWICPLDAIYSDSSGWEIPCVRDSTYDVKTTVGGNCSGDYPRCEGNDLLQCYGNKEKRTPCGPNGYCVSRGSGYCYPYQPTGTTTSTSRPSENTTFTSTSITPVPTTRLLSESGVIAKPGLLFIENVSSVKTAKIISLTLLNEYIPVGKILSPRESFEYDYSGKCNWFTRTITRTIRGYIAFGTPDDNYQTKIKNISLSCNHAEVIGIE